MEVKRITLKGESERYTWSGGQEDDPGVRVRKIYLEWRSRGTPWSVDQKDLQDLEWRSRGSPWSEGRKDLPGIEVERITLE